MPRGKDFCPYEKGYFPLDDFKVVDGTRLHCVTPLHRAADGVLVKKSEDKVSALSPRVFHTMAKRKS